MNFYDYEKAVVEEVYIEKEAIPKGLRKLLLSRRLAERLHREGLHSEEEILVGCVALLRNSQNPQVIIDALTAYSFLESNVRKNQGCQAD